MIKTLKLVEAGTSMSTPQGQTLVQYRITTTDGERFMTYLFSTIPPPQPNQQYNIEVTGEVNWKWGDDKLNILYKKVKLTKVSPTTTQPNIFQQSSPESTPTQIVSTNNDVEYHKLAMDYLYKIDKLNLHNLSRLAPYMKQIVDGRLSPDKVGELHLEFFPDNPFS